MQVHTQRRGAEDAEDAEKNKERAFSNDLGCGDIGCPRNFTLVPSASLRWVWNYYRYVLTHCVRDD